MYKAIDHNHHHTISTMRSSITYKES